MTMVLDRGTEAGRSSRPATVRVWDPLVRVFHWALAAAFVIAWATSEDMASAHEFAGYVILGLIAFRLVWGLIGSRHARFTDFLYRPRTILRFLMDSLAFRARRYIGHNPAGGAMVIALLVALAATAGSGFMMTTDAFWGVRWVRETHGLAFNLLLLLVILHLAGVALASFEHRGNLVKAMFTGRKRTAESS